MKFINAAFDLVQLFEVLVYLSVDSVGSFEVCLFTGISENPHDFGLLSHTGEDETILFFWTLYCFHFVHFLYQPSGSFWVYSNYGTYFLKKCDLVWIYPFALIIDELGT